MMNQRSKDVLFDPVTGEAVRERIPRCPNQLCRHPVEDNACYCVSCGTEIDQCKIMAAGQRTFCGSGGNPVPEGNNVHHAGHAIFHTAEGKPTDPHNPSPLASRPTWNGIERGDFWAGMMIIFVVFLGYIFPHHDQGFARFCTLMAIAFGFLITMSRLHNIGMSRWWGLLLLVPVLNLWIIVRCAIDPEDNREMEKKWIFPHRP